jgi:hypothetical protein
VGSLVCPCRPYPCSCVALILYQGLVGCKTLYLRNGAVCVEYDKVAVVLNGICHSFHSSVDL